MKLRFHNKVALAFLAALLICMLLLNLLSGLLLRPIFIVDSRRQMARYCAQIDRALTEGKREEIEDLLLSLRTLTRSTRPFWDRMSRYSIPPSRTGPGKSRGNFPKGF